MQGCFAKRRKATHPGYAITGRPHTHFYITFMI